MVIAVAFGLGKHEKIFVSAGGTVFHALRRDIWFVPDDIATEKPAIFLQRERKSPRNTK